MDVAVVTETLKGTDLVRLALATASASAAPGTVAPPVPVLTTAPLDRLASCHAVITTLVDKAKLEPASVIKEALQDKAMLDALAYLRANAPAHFERLLFDLRDAQVKQRDVASLKKALPRAQEEARWIPSLAEAVVVDSWLPSGWRLPRGWSFEDDEGTPGLYAVREGKEGKTYRRAAWVPVAVIGWAKDITTGAEFVVVAWKCGAWARRTVPRQIIADTRQLVQLAAFGFPVTSTVAKDLVEYLAEVENQNRSRMSFELRSSQLGWLEVDGRKAFLFGNELLAGDHAVAVKFHGDDVGDDKIAAGYGSTSGTMEGWLAAVADLGPFWRVQVGIYAALASPVLEILSAENFVLEKAGETSKGKTSSLEVAASTSGNPDQRADDTVVETWDATRVALERGAAIRNGLTTFRDDTKRARNLALVAQCVYDHASGRQRSRGSKEGLGETKSFRGVLISTGEAPLASFSEDGGTRGRIIPLWGSPFEAASAEVATTINNLIEGVRANYGHAGPAFVRHLLANHHQWPALRERWLAMRKKYINEAGADAIAGRRGGHVAVLELAAEIAHEVFSLPWDYRVAIRNLWATVRADSTETDLPRRALRQALDWAASNPRKFMTGASPSPIGTFASTPQEPHGGWLGRRDEETDPPMFFTEPLTDFIKARGHSPAAIFKSWHDRGWLDVDKDGTHLTKRVRVGGRNPGLYALTAKALKSAETDTDEDDDGCPF